MSIYLPRRCLVPFKKFSQKRFLVKSLKTHKQVDNFVIVRPTTDDTSEILDLMWQSYLPDEPTIRTLGLGTKRNCVFDEGVRKNLCKGYSLVAKCKCDGAIVGAALNDITSPWDPDMTEKFACHLKDPNMARYFMFWAYIQRVPKLWEKYGQRQIFEISKVFVRHAERKKGLASKLIKESLDLGIDAGFKVLRIDASSVYTASICEKLGLQLVYEVPFDSYVSKENQVIFKVEPPHQSVKTYVALSSFQSQK